MLAILLGAKNDLQTFETPMVMHLLRLKQIICQTNRG